MKARVGMSKKERKVMEEEINKQTAKMIREQEESIDLMLRYYLHEKYGFGKKRINDFIKGFNEELDKLSDWYEMGQTDQLFLVKYKLKQYHLLEEEEKNE